MTTPEAKGPRGVRALADERGLAVAALASPLWKWCRPEAKPAAGPGEHATALIAPDGRAHR